ncbi:MAG TPA: GTPase [Polyangiaceae bacterium]|jgi:predicted GTPase|nr:GTPase [Polyangiaceae bacterium]
MSEPREDPLKTLARAIARLEELLDRLPVEVARDLRVRITTLRTLMLEKRPPALALVGRRGAGKSSLVNALFGAKLAELGHVTAQTGRGRWYDYEREGGAMSILDTRGVQEGSAPAEEHDGRTAIDALALELRAKAPDLIVFVAKASEVDAAVDADIDVIERVYKEVKRAHRIEPPLVAVVTQCDLLEPKETRLHQTSGAARESKADLEEKLKYVSAAERAIAAKIDERPALRDRHVATLGVSAYMSWRPDGTLRADERWRIDDLALLLFRHLPDASRAELARATGARAVQEELAISLTRATAAVCAGIAAAPIPLADIVPLTTLQVGLVAAIAWVAGRSIDRRGAAEFLAGLGANVGAAFVLREAFRAVLKVIVPGGGSVISATIAFTGTTAVGAAARAYYIRGLSLGAARKAFQKKKAETPEEAPRESADESREREGAREKTNGVGPASPVTTEGEIKVPPDRQGPTGEA